MKLLSWPGFFAFLLITTGAWADTNKVVVLNGDDDSFVLLPCVSSVQGGTSITVEAWVWSAGDIRNADAAVLNVGDGLNSTSDRAWDVRFSPSGVLAVEVFFADGTWTSLTTPSATNAWTHVAFTFDSSAGFLGLYTNGVQAAATNSVGEVSLKGKVIRPTAQNLLIGGIMDIPSTRFHGYLDDLRIWSKARTQGDIAFSMWCPLSGGESNLVAYYDFENGVTDLTGHGFNGDLQYGATIGSAQNSDYIHSGCISCRVVGTQFTADRLMQLTVTATVGKPVRLDSSTNLSSWVPLVTFPNTGGIFQFIDPETKNYGRRFYRAVVP